MNNGQAKTQGIYPVSLRDIEGIWRFKEAHWANVTDEVKDSSGNNNHGIAIGPPKIVNDTQRGRVGLFNEDNGEYVRVESSFGLTGTVTISVWIKGTDQDAAIVHIPKTQSDAGTSIVVTVGDLQFRVNAPALRLISANFDVLDDKWHHVVGMYGGGRVKIYVDGIKRGDTNKTGAQSVNLNKTFFGVFSDSFTTGGNAWNGKLDLAMIWSRELSDGEARVLYTHQLSELTS